MSDQRPLRLQEQVRMVIRTLRYSRRTEQAYWHWIQRSIRFHGIRHPKELGERDVREFMTWLAVRKKVAASTQNQALNALRFLYARVLERPLGDIGTAVRAKRPPRLPVVLSHTEAMSIIRGLDNPYRLMASLMYGSGLRVAEVSRLRVKDIDFTRCVVTVRNGKGGKDRTTLLPDELIAPLSDRVHAIRRAMTGQSARIPVTLPFALQRAVRCAVTRPGLSKPIGCHTFRHRFATQLLLSGCDRREPVIAGTPASSRRTVVPRKARA